MLEVCGTSPRTNARDQESKIGNKGFTNSSAFKFGSNEDAVYKIGDKYSKVLVKYGKKLAMSLK
jgi:hypothetical protein